MAKYLEVQSAKEYADTILADPILQMAVNAVLNNAPAADVAEVVHGRWIDNCCSNCNTICTVNVNGEEIVVEMKSNYCPHCGAIMDLEG